MFVYLSKVLPLFVYPLGLSITLILLSLALYRWRLLQAVCLLGAVGILLIFGNGRTAGMLARTLEWQYLPEADLPQADVIVLLGGGTRPANFPRTMTETNEAGDRMRHAARLYLEGKAPHILASGGYIEWLGSQTPEAEGMQEILEWYGVPGEAIWLESGSRNTYENAVNVRQVLEPLGITRILLVTSALHMPRSVRIFERQGFDVVAAPADYQVTESDDSEGAAFNADLFYLLPSAEYLELSTRVIKEYIGLLVYRLRGWL